MDDISRRLGEIERRLMLLEARLAVVPRASFEPDTTTPLTPPPAALDAPAPTGPSSVGQASPGVAPFAPVVTPAPVATVVPVVPIVPGADVDERGYPLDRDDVHTPPPLPKRVGMYVAAQSTTPAPAGAMPAPPIEYRPRTAPGPTPGIEQTIGLKWAGWIGAVVLVIGAALAFKFAYDQGWLGRIPDVAKVAVLSACGFVLIGIGEWVLRRIDRLAAAGLYGAGVAILFVSSYAGYAWYGLFAQNTAFALMAASALTGALLAVRADLVSIAILATIGGNIAPIVLSTGHVKILPFLSYLLFLQLMALALCWWRATPKWWVLRGLSLVSTGLWMTGVVFSREAQAGRDYRLAVGFSVLFALLYHAELIATTLRAARAASREEIDRTVGVIFSLLVTGAFICWILILYRNSAENVRAAWVIGTGAACATVGLMLMKLSRERLSALSYTLRVQAVMLLILAVPVGLSGPSVVFGWIVLALGLAVAGRVARLTISSLGSAVVWILAVSAWKLWSDSDPAEATWLTIAGVALSGRIVVAGALVLAGHLVAVCLDPSRLKITDENRAAFKTLESVLHVLATLLWAAAAIGYLKPIPATLLIALHASLLTAASFIPVLAELGVIATVVFAALATEWVVFDQIIRRLGGQQRGPDLPPIANRETALGIALCVIVLACAWASERLLRIAAPASRKVIRQALFTLVPVLILGIGCVEIDRYAVLQTAGPVWIVRQVGWSIWWAIASVICLLVGFGMHARQVRLFALALLGVTLVKIVVVDLSGAGTGWRILSFIGLGVVLLGTSVLYGKFGSRAAELQRD